MDMICKNASASEVGDAEFLEQQVKPRRLSSEAVLVLHAALLAHAGGQLALTGPTGIGKSTLSAGLQRLGWSLWGDDTMGISTGAGRPQAHALAPVFG